MFMLIARGDDLEFHLVRFIAQEGMGIRVVAYCEAKGKKEIHQLPVEFFDKCCKACQEELEAIKGQAS